MDQIKLDLKKQSISNMHILLVNDSKFELKLVKGILQAHGFQNVSTASSAIDALEIIGIQPSEKDIQNPDLILMNLIMPYMDGIKACQLIKSSEGFEGIPIIIMTSMDRDEEIQKAFDAGATDFVSIPIREVELIARVKTALSLKREMDERKFREQELLQVMRQLDQINKHLTNLSFIDGLTGVYNRRYFDEKLKQEWKSSMRYQHPLSLLLIDIDFFKLYNDYYGHYLGDDCLRRVAESLKSSITRGCDTVARYGGEEFAVILPDMDEQYAFQTAQQLRENVYRLQIPHRESKVSSFVTVSIGGCSMIPQTGMNPGQLITQADEALYWAKKQGRNQVYTVLGVDTTQDKPSSSTSPTFNP